MMVSTTAPTSGALAYPLRNLFEAAGGTALACILIFTVPARRKSWRAILGLMILSIIVSTAISCGGGSHHNTSGGTTAGSYVFTVTGSASGSGNSTIASGTVQVTVN
jgi:hypothetical protein